MNLKIPLNIYTKCKVLNIKRSYEQILEPVHIGGQANMGSNSGKIWTLILQIHFCSQAELSYTVRKPNIKCETGAQKKRGTRLWDKKLYENGLGGLVTAY